MSDEDFEGGEEIRGAYSEAKSVKFSIIYKKNEVLQLLQDHHYYSGVGSYPSDLYLKITSNLVTLYRLIKPMLTPKKPNEKYKEYKNKIEKIMNKMIDRADITEVELYKVSDDMIEFIHLLGITDLTIDGIKKNRFRFVKNE